MQESGSPYASINAKERSGGVRYWVVCDGTPAGGFPTYDEALAAHAARPGSRIFYLF
jgi:hypothetical protein